ncbi:hypothetical protein EDC02_3243 [Micromonospora sp. Llam0]|uniref:mCpol domain-containing protein n=1 Tax=Micromonospora sp. Llam0 TaxID=2485143 RepID=UPI000FAEFE0F|nr:mCpol domain-containing protein [Micromonospora sp. Llam0]ROO61310.1 hypothetical protein EDC02_3243 [Micromonospora sp. Llam0]
MTARWFLALDGDDIGRRLELYMLTENLHDLQTFARDFSQTVSRVVQSLQLTPDVDIILGSGDSILARLPQREIERSISLVKQATANTGFSFSGGYAETMQGAYLALKVAKSTGKNRIIPAPQRPGIET